MGIKYYIEDRIWKLDTKGSSYIIAAVDDEGFVGHVYYGKKLEDYKLTHLMRLEESPFLPSKNNRERASFYDRFPMEYSSHGIGDYRESSLKVKAKNGSTACSLQYISYEIIKGKPQVKGLPSTFADEKECTTLNLLCKDIVLDLEVTLIYTVFEDLDVVTRRTKIKNCNKDKVDIKKALSSCVDFDGMDYDVITMHGSWARERHIQRVPVSYGKQSTSSIRGVSSHQDHPFLALISKDGTEDYGEVFAFNFVYSGNFIGQVEGTQFDTVRVVMGIHPTDFSWSLEYNEEFVTPEVVMVYSDQGIGKMTRTFHDLYRKHLIRGKYKDRKRPILINNWEATYFDFNSEKLISIAKEAKKLGIEMLVMDDGWFGDRASDNSALGDWIVNENKITGGLKTLVDQINEIGLEFGIWFEPEMISPNSNLYKEHPDWAIQIPGRVGTLSRHQYVLDYSRKEVRDYIYNSMKKILKSANITYLKWDMNRQLTDLASSILSSDNQGELYHRYVLGVYDMMDQITKDFPDILLENCSGGGGRFDPAMLYYSPQIWTSDNMDPIERLKIQQGTAMIYPLSSMGAHVCDSPNHITGRHSPFETRGYVALSGTFGYELDITKLSQEDRSMIPMQIETYHKYNDLVRRGDYYRISNYIENHEYDCWQIVSKDKSEVLLTFIQVLGRANFPSKRIRFKGLQEEAYYKNQETKEMYSGAALMHAGINVLKMQGDFKGKLIHFIRS